MLCVLPTRGGQTRPGDSSAGKTTPKRPPKKTREADRVAQGVHRGGRMKTRRDHAECAHLGLWVCANTRSIVRPSVSAIRCFEMNAEAPSRSAAARTAGSSDAERMMTAVSGVNRFTRRQTSKPSMSGIIRSATRTSGLSLLTASTASQPFETLAITSQYVCSKRPIAASTCGKSSTNTTRGLRCRLEHTGGTLYSPHTPTDP